MKLLKKVILILFLLTAFLFAQSTPVHHSKTDIYCRECHLCDKPSEMVPCLKCCPEFSRKAITVHHSVDKAPETIKIDILSKQYAPSIFSHRLHAEMSDMAGGCVLCHHFNPPGQVASCRECHPITRKRENLRKPDLKGAYHRQCIGCHLEWSHSNDCVFCHEPAKKGDGENIAARENNTDVTEKYKGKTHPRITAPPQKIYTTEFEEGKLVTFYHNDHVRMYNLKCTDCHQNEKCGSCHDIEKNTPFSNKDPHDNCISCHENAIDENCSFCHSDKQRPPFDHKVSTGWELKKYHKSLNCRSCHGQVKSFQKINRSCSFCHKLWEMKDFRHEVTGLRLDEIHSENDCNACHIQNNFEKKPICSECHEDDIKYPEYLPGGKPGA